MITLERTRELLSELKLSDSEVQVIRNELYKLADLFIDSLEEKELTKNDLYYETEFI